MCAVGESRDEAMYLIREAIEIHIESLRKNGELVPPPGTLSRAMALE
jgi:predicted RNase H-like HicB family nuclease